MSLTVIDGIKKEEVDYYKLYFNAFKKCVERMSEENKKDNGISLNEKKRFIYYGIKMINHQDEKNISINEYLLRLDFMDGLKIYISSLTPNEFENIFPIDKDYRSGKYQMKDYFYVRNYLNSIGKDTEIGNNVADFLWNYMNYHVMSFNVNYFSAIDDIRRINGEKGMIEEFFEEKGLTTYTLTTDEKGKQYLQNNNTGEVARMKKPKPRYLNVVK